MTQKELIEQDIPDKVAQAIAEQWSDYIIKQKYS